MASKREFSDAVQEGDIEAAKKYLLEHKHIVNRALLHAVGDYNVKMVEVLLKYGVYNNLSEVLKFTIEDEVNKRIVEKIETFISKSGINSLWAGDSMGDFLVNSIMDKKRELIRLLLEYGADVQFNNNWALIEAITTDEKMVDILLDHGADANALTLSNDGTTVPVLFYALKHRPVNPYSRVGGKNTNIVISLINHGANVNYHNESPLFNSMDSKILKFMLEHGADIHKGMIRTGEEENWKYTQKDTILLYHVDKHPYIENIELLLYYGADINKYNDDIVVSAVKNLLRRSLRMRGKGKFSENQLILRLLIRYGANPDIIIDGGWVLLLLPSTIKFIFDTYMSVVKLGSKKAWDFWIKWSPFLSEEYQQTTKSLKKQKVHSWGFGLNEHSLYEEMIRQNVPENLRLTEDYEPEKVSIYEPENEEEWYPYEIENTQILDVSRIMKI
jgi:hypothetical protein